MNIHEREEKGFDIVIFIGGAKVVTIKEDEIVYEKDGVNNELSGYDGIVLAFGSRATNTLID